MDVHVVRSNGGPYYTPKRVLVGVAKAHMGPPQVQPSRNHRINQTWGSTKVSHVSRMKSIFMKSTSQNSDLGRGGVISIHCQAADTCQRPTSSPPPPTATPDGEVVESSLPCPGPVRRTSLWSPIYRERLDEWRKLSKGSTCSDTSEDSLCSSDCSSLTRGSGSMYDIHWSKGFSPKENLMDNEFKLAGHVRQEDSEVFTWSGGSGSRGSTPLHQISRGSSPQLDQRRDSTSSVTSVSSASVRDMIRLFDNSEDAKSQTPTRCSSRAASRSNSITNVNVSPAYLCDKIPSEDHTTSCPRLQPKLPNGSTHNITAHGHGNMVQLRVEQKPINTLPQPTPIKIQSTDRSNSEQKENNPHILNISRGNDSSINVTVGKKSSPLSSSETNGTFALNSGQLIEGQTLIDPSNVRVSKKVIYTSTPKTDLEDGTPQPTQTGGHSRASGLSQHSQRTNSDRKSSHPQFRNQVYICLLLSIFFVPYLISFVQSRINLGLFSGDFTCPYLYLYCIFPL